MCYNCGLNKNVKVIINGVKYLICLICNRIINKNNLKIKKKKNINEINILYI
jgi:hypothetical protein